MYGTGTNIVVDIRYSLWQAEPSIQFTVRPIQSKLPSKLQEVQIGWFVENVRMLC